ncbi:hypothetical protein [Rhodococcus qingshengii]|uniref:hypothetical protein n=1 Tax=Rhodococcus qingshengii TaxID=334542 RepID=UPI002AFE46A5|nr:hypothetical protein [Rhodococcus qingshengii]MEA1798681.1 hypothetical protein [Rhodococcus qingshengii]
MSIPWFKMETGVSSKVKNGLTASDLGLYVYIMEAAKMRSLALELHKNDTGAALDLHKDDTGVALAQHSNCIRLTLREVKALAAELKIRQADQALQRLVDAEYLAEVSDSHVDVVWTLQLERKSVTTSTNGKLDIAALCATGDHSSCYRPFCSQVERWARNHGPTHTCRRCRAAAKGDSESDSESKQNPLTETLTETETDPLKGSGEGEVSQNLDSPAPGGAARPEPGPSEAGAPVDDDEDYTPPPKRKWKIG